MAIKKRKVQPKCKTVGCRYKAVKGSKLCGACDPEYKRYTQVTNKFMRSKAGKFLMKQMDKQKSLLGMKSIDAEALEEIDMVVSARNYMSGFYSKQGRIVQRVAIHVCHLAPSRQKIGGVDYIGSNHPKNLMVGCGDQNMRDSNRPYKYVTGEQIHPFYTKRDKREKKPTVKRLVTLIGLGECEKYLDDPYIKLGGKYGSTKTDEERQRHVSIEEGCRVLGLLGEMRRIKKYYHEDAMDYLEAIEQAVSKYVDKGREFRGIKRGIIEGYEQRMQEGSLAQKDYYALIHDESLKEELRELVGKPYDEYLESVMKVWSEIFFVTRANAIEGKTKYTY